MILAEAMAMAVIKGDLVAAYALADLLVEQKNTEGGTPMQQAAKAIRGRGHAGVQSYEVCSSPEFLAFAARFGIVSDLNTTTFTIHLPVAGYMSVVQEYIGRDVGPNEM